MTTRKTPARKVKLSSLADFCRRHRVGFWGKTHLVQPRLVEWIHGDGLQIIALQPLATRPDRYIARIDSKIDLNSDGKEGFHGEVLESLYTEIESQFGVSEEENKPWPAIDDSCGCSWWQIAVLAKPDLRHPVEVKNELKRAIASRGCSVARRLLKAKRKTRKDGAS